MFSLSSSNRFFLYQKPADMRKSFNGLSGLVRNEMNTNPMDGNVYVFLNKNRTLIKLLHWEDSGFTLYFKRLEKGVFERPDLEENNHLTWQKLVLIMEGISIDSIRKKKRFNLPNNLVN